MDRRLLVPLALAFLFLLFDAWRPAGAAARLAALAGAACVLAAAWGAMLWEGELLQSTSRTLRHQLANRLQTVSGWLQLGRTAEAERALARTFETLEGWRRLEQLPRVSAARWARLVREAEAAGRTVILRGDKPKPRAPWTLIRQARDAARRGQAEIVVDLEAGTITEGRTVKP